MQTARAWSLLSLTHLRVPRMIYRSSVLLTSPAARSRLPSTARSRFARPGYREGCELLRLEASL